MFEFMLFFSKYLEFIAITPNSQSNSRYFPASAVSNDESWLNPYK